MDEMMKYGIQIQADAKSHANHRQKIASMKTKICKIQSLALWLQNGSQRNF
jgi:hypothetical protein